MPTFKQIIKEGGKVLRRYGKHHAAIQKQNILPSKEEEQNSPCFKARPSTSQLEDAAATQPSLPRVRDSGVDHIKIVKSSPLHDMLQTSLDHHVRLQTCEKETKTKVDELFDQFECIQSEIQALDDRITEAKNEDLPANGGDLVAMEAALESLLDEKDTVIDERNRIEAQLKKETQDFRDQTLNFFESLRDLLGRGENSPDDGEEPLSSHVHGESQQMRVKADHAICDSDEHAHGRTTDPVCTRREQEAPDKEPEQQEEPAEDPNYLLADYNISRQELADAVCALQTRHERFDGETIARAPGFETERQIEQRQFFDTQEMTRRIFRAENDVARMKAKLIKVGHQPPGSEVESGLVDDSDDGYRISSGENDIEDTRSHRPDTIVQRWLKEVLAAQYDGYQLLDADMEPEEPRDRPACCLVEPEMWESLSMMAEGRRRRKIDDWIALTQADTRRNEDCIPADISSPASSREWKSKASSKVRKFLVSVAKGFEAGPLVP